MRLRLIQDIHLCKKGRGRELEDSRYILNVGSHLRTIRLICVKIVDATSQVENSYQTGAGTKTSAPNSQQADRAIDSTSPHAERIQSPASHISTAFSTRRTIGQTTHHQPQWQSESPSFDTPLSMTASHPDDISLRTNEGQYMHAEVTSELAQSPSFPYTNNWTSVGARDTQNKDAVSDHQVISPHGSSISQVNTEDAAADLLALRYMPPDLQSRNFHLVLQDSPTDASVLRDVVQDQVIYDTYEDGIFLPGSAYKEFHSTLRDHLIYTAKSSVPTRNPTPDLQQDLNVPGGTVPRRNNQGDARLESDPESRPPDITLQREYVLWRTWIEEVAPWVINMPPLLFHSNSCSA